MGKPAARIGDTAGHAGTILFGSSTVFIGGRPAARVGDALVCPGFDGTKPHVMGNITIGSFTVIIEGAFAARLGDPTGCGVIGVSGSSTPPVIGPSIPGSFDNADSVIGDKNAGFIYGRYSGYHNSDGKQHAVEGSIEHLGGETNMSNGGAASGSIDGITGSAEFHSGSGGGGGSAQVSIISAQGKITDANGSSFGGSGSVGSVNASIEALAGKDGRRTGVVYGAGAGASAVEGEGYMSVVIPIPFTECDIEAGGSVGSGIGVGAAAAAGAYHDSADQRYHAMGMLDIAAVLKAKVSAEVSMGCGHVPLLTSFLVSGVGIPMTPGTILSGCLTVLIG